jgi:SAM-dependent methyltransferase
MDEEDVSDRIRRYLWFDLTHIDRDIVEMYGSYVVDRVVSLFVKPDLSSETLHWRRYYHQFSIENPGAAIFVPEPAAKKSIHVALKHLGSTSSSPFYCLDVGCGPTSQFFTKDLLDRDDLKVITVDPLAEVYKQIHRKYGSEYGIVCIPGYGERLHELFPEGLFHLAYTQNAIDHSQSPEEFIRSLHYVTMPGGYLILHGFIREGTAAHWLGLHQWDIEVEGNNLLLSNRGKTVDKKNITEDLDMSLIYRYVGGGAVGDMYTLIYQKSGG